MRVRGGEGRDGQRDWAEAGNGEALYRQQKLGQKCRYLLCSPLEERKGSLHRGLGECRQWEKIHRAREREDPEDRADTWLSQLVPVRMSQSQVLLVPSPPAEEPQGHTAAHRQH